jgi:ATP-dependent Clp protease protease subunit
MRPCYQFHAAAADKPALLSIHEEIGFWGVQAKEFLASLSSIESKELTVEINSPGGDVFAATAMYNALRASGKAITTKVMGVAASAASLVLMAGDKRVMPKNTHVMIHNPWTVAMGNAEELREQAETLDKIGSSLTATYVARTGMKEEDLAPMLAKDTWLTADEALANGFATELVDDVVAKATFDMARADLPPEVAKVYAQAQKTEAEIEAERVAAEEAAAAAAKAAIDAAANPVVAQEVHDATVAAGLKDFAGVFALACTSLDEAKTRISATREIVALCKFAKAEDKAAGFVKANKPVSEVRAALVEAMATADEPIAATPPAKKSSTQAGGVNSKTLWASHNSQRQRKD